jgi:hypothetical protein
MVQTISSPEAMLNSKLPTLSHIKLRRIVNVVAPQLRNNNGVERG